MLKDYMRIKFELGKQKLFLRDSKEKLNISWNKLAGILDTPYGTIMSYSNELCFLSYPLFSNICRLCNWNESNTLHRYKGEKYELTEGNIPFKKGYLFGKKRMDLVGIKPLKKKIIKLDTNCITYSNSDRKKGIILPKFLDENLAEEMGVHLGDGFLSDKKYDFRVKGDRTNEIEYYEGYLTRLYKKLYNINLENRDYKDSYGFEIYSKALWEFKVKVLDITPGKKEVIQVPTIIKNAHEPILCAFIRGMMDTDGSLIFKSKYGHKYYYPIITITCKSEFLAKDINGILEKLGFRSRLYQGKDRYWAIYLYGYANFTRYQKVIGWHNPKNLKRIKERNRLWPRSSNGTYEIQALKD